MSRVDWSVALDIAAGFVNGNVLPVTLRQTYYHLMSRHHIPPTDSAYKYLSAITAEARRAGTFPSFADETRKVTSSAPHVSIRQTLIDAAYNYRTDRTRGQEFSIWVVAEKRGMVPALEERFGDFGFHVFGCGGYVSQTLADSIHNTIARDGRPAICLYGGDLDASGEDIARDFEKRVGAFDQFVRVAVTPEQVTEYDLPENPGKERDSRAGTFTDKHGRNFQVEVDALDPVDLDRLYRLAAEPFWDREVFNTVTGTEAVARAAGLAFATSWPGV
jgi:hypothetical protein